VFRITPLQDQILAGSLMWVLGSFFCFIPAVAITVKLLSPQLVQPSVHVAKVWTRAAKEVPPKTA
jgi:hypothetical protein